MKKTTIKRFIEDPGQALAIAQRERVVVTRNGKPVGLIIGLANLDEEDLAYMTSATFWQEVRDWRRRPVVPWEDVKARLLKARTK